jgi:hypothetical protein
MVYLKARRSCWHRPWVALILSIVFGTAIALGIAVLSGRVGERPSDIETHVRPKTRPLWHCVQIEDSMGEDQMFCSDNQESVRVICDRVAGDARELGIKLVGCKSGRLVE